MTQREKQSVSKYSEVHFWDLIVLYVYLCSKKYSQSIIFYIVYLFCPKCYLCPLWQTDRHIHIVTVQGNQYSLTIVILIYPAMGISTVLIHTFMVSLHASTVCNKLSTLQYLLFLYIRCAGTLLSLIHLHAPLLVPLLACSIWALLQNLLVIYCTGSKCSLIQCPRVLIHTVN